MAARNGKQVVIHWGEDREEPRRRHIVLSEQVEEGNLHILMQHLLIDGTPLVVTWQYVAEPMYRLASQADAAQQEVHG